MQADLCFEPEVFCFYHPIGWGRLELVQNVGPVVEVGYTTYFPKGFVMEQRKNRYWNYVDEITYRPIFPSYFKTCVYLATQDVHYEETNVMWPKGFDETIYYDIVNYLIRNSQVEFNAELFDRTDFDVEENKTNDYGKTTYFGDFDRFEINRILIREAVEKMYYNRQKDKQKTL